MNNLTRLVAGEFQRLAKYKILQSGLGVTVLWVLVLFLIGRDEGGLFIPLFLFMDLTMMTVLLIGAGLFYERQENTLKTLLITPTKLSHIIFSKLISAVYIALQSAVFLGLLGYLFFDSTVKFYYLLPFTLLIALTHAMIGYTFSVLVKDFTGLLAAIMSYMILFAFPSIFYALDILGDTWEYLLLISPTHGSMLLVDLSFGKSVAPALIILSVLYLVALSFILAKFIVFPKYIEKAIKE